jgi:hypothetical protein
MKEKISRGIQAVLHQSKVIATSSVAMICFTSALLALVAAIVSDVVTINFAYGTLWFLVVCAIFHGILWEVRATNTQNQLRALEYVYIIIGLVGALGVVEIRSSFVDTEMKLSRGEGWGRRTDYCVTYELDREKANLTSAQSLSCKFERDANSLTSPYNHGGLRNLLDRAKNYFATRASEEEKALMQPYADYLESTWSRMDEIYKKYDLVRKLPSEFDKLISDRNWLLLRIVGFYMLLVGVAIKFAKTTAEINGWFAKERTAA